MKAETKVGRTTRTGAMLLGGSVVAAATFLLAAPHAANPGAAAPVAKSSAVTLESIPGSSVKRVMLSAKAAERLGIATATVGEEVVVRKQMVSGLVIPPMDRQTIPQPAVHDLDGASVGVAAAAARPVAAAATAQKLASVGFAGFARGTASATPPQPAAERVSSPTNGEVWMLVTLSPAEWERLAKDKPARLLALGTRDKLANDVLAQPSGMPPLQDLKRSMMSLYYVVPGKDHGLTVNHRMRVELQLTGSDEKQKVVPYSALYYDGKGTPWVYVNTRPLVFERQRVGVERVVGDLVVLSAGPPIGTPVVTVGASLLYGAEIFGK
jgi:hypothetical protein